MQVGGDAGLALVGAKRPKKGNRRGDAPASIVDIPVMTAEGDQAIPLMYPLFLSLIYERSILITEYAFETE